MWGALSDTFLMMSLFVRPENEEKLRCAFTSAIDMIPKDEPRKNIIREYIHIHPFPQEKQALWMYEFISYVTFQTTNRRLPSYEIFIEPYRNGDITTWSHPTWDTIHTLAAGYDGTDDYALSYKSFISCLQWILPCPRCREHLRDNLANIPIDRFFRSKDTLFLWSYLLHQRVSMQLEKPGISYDAAKRKYNVK